MQPDISASDIGSYTFCARQYWLKSHHVRPDAEGAARLRSGFKEHQRHGLRARRAWRFGQTAETALALAVLVLVLVMLLGAARPISEDLAGPLVLLLLVIAAGLSWLAYRSQRATGLPTHAGIVASDTGTHKVEFLSDPTTGLKGKPDYVLLERGVLRQRYVVAEVKPTRRAQRLYESDELQLVAYMILLRARYGRKAGNHGYVAYRDTSFKVELTRERIERCLAVVEAARQAKQAANVHRSHRHKSRCSACSWEGVCDESLAPHARRTPRPRQA
jgi:CRISPR/Cas system-associated exonuclease Cas4 (RecB family)